MVMALTLVPGWERSPHGHLLLPLKGFVAYLIIKSINMTYLSTISYKFIPYMIHDIVYLII